ncbi:MAG: OadG family protein [Eubacterium sp.]|nr:OadG family protein [Eubacterium sp.]
MGAKLITALLNTLLGMGTVFLVLIFISLVISLFKYIPRLQARAELRRKRKKLEEEERVPERPAARRPILPDPVEEEEEENLIYDGELVAVIMAAILASTGGAVSADKLVVRSIRRVKSKNRR